MVSIYPAYIYSIINICIQQFKYSSPLAGASWTFAYNVHIFC